MYFQKQLNQNNFCQQYCFEDYMDQRIDFVAKLKNQISSQRSSSQSITTQKESNSNQYDIQYQLFRSQILTSPFMKRSNQHMHIRLTNWIKKLDRIKENKIWILNRNNYVKILHLMCHCEYITHPFNHFPPQTDLPNLLKHDISKIIDQIERKIKSEKITSRKTSITLENAQNHLHYSSSNAMNELRRFKTQTNTCGDQDNDTVPLRKLNGKRTFQTDFEDKTISFNFSTDHHCLSQNVENCQEDQGHIYKENQIKKYRSHSHHNKELKDISNFQNRMTMPSQGQPSKKVQRKTSFHKKSKPPLYKRLKPSSKEQILIKPEMKQEYKKQYWESNGITNNNSGEGTPKYLDKYEWSEQKLSSNEVEIVSHRDGEGEGNCISKVFGDGWLFQLFSKIGS